jgi:hypothetical protein
LITLGSPPKKGGQKKTLVLTLGSPPEKGEKKQRRFRHRKRCPNVARRKKKKKKTVPILPANVIGRTGRFCRGTSSDGQAGFAAERHRTDAQTK